jgi:MT0933-like antitoxin protein
MAGSALADECPGGRQGGPVGLLEKLKSAISGRKEQVSGGIDKAGDIVDEKTGGKYVSQVDTAQEKAKDMLGDEEQT